MNKNLYLSIKRAVQNIWLYKNESFGYCNVILFVYMYKETYKYACVYM